MLSYRCDKAFQFNKEPIYNWQRSRFLNSSTIKSKHKLCVQLSQTGDGGGDEDDDDDDVLGDLSV